MPHEHGYGGNRQLQEQISDVIRLHGTGSLDEARFLLASMRPPELAVLLESTPPHVRRVLWELIDEEDSTRTLQYLHDDVLGDFLEDMEPEDLVAVADELDTDDFADILQKLPDTISSQVLASLDASDRA
ncbi:MAG: magnesium transporter, partial [Gammaproteobacteria bacterium]